LKRHLNDSIRHECFGQVSTLDNAGNTQATAALKNRADRSTDQDGKNSPITAKVTGTKDAFPDCAADRWSDVLISLV
jgi:hypothetical protein